MSTSTALRGELDALARELLRSEGFAAFAAKPGAARVSEPLLPAFLAALWPRAMRR